MDFSLLLTDEEYQERFAGKNHPTPYVYELRSGEQMLMYFGVRHSRNPDDAQWEKLKISWEDFFRKTSLRRIILLEGGKPLQLEDNWPNVVRKYGEAGVILSFSRGSGAEIAWPDLAINKEAEKLSEQFESNLVAYYIFARSAGAWLRAGTMGTFDEVLMKAVVATSQRVFSAPDTVSVYAAIHNQIFKHPLDETQKKVIIRASAPVYYDSIINDIARASSRFRNEHIVNEVERYWKEGYSIFLVFGSAHAVIQEAALRAMVEK